MEAVGIVTTIALGLVGTLILAAIIRGWAMSILWGWFAVPVFGVPSLSVMQAFGLALLVGAALPANQTREAELKKSDKTSTFGRLVGALMFPVMTVGVGWIVKQWI